MNKGRIVCGVAAALICSGLIWAIGGRDNPGIAGWETLNVSMEQAIGTLNAETTAADGQNSQLGERSEEIPKTTVVQGVADGNVKKDVSVPNQSSSEVADGVQTDVNSVASTGQNSENIMPAAGTNGMGVANPTAEEPVTQPDTLNGRVNVNTAGSSELMDLPGIGEKKAQAIIDYRNSKGAFRSLSDLGKVKGIGTKMLEKLEPLVVF